MIAIDQEPDRVPRRILVQAAIVIGAGIAASVLVTLLLIAPYVGELTRPSEKIPGPLDTGLFLLPTEGELERQAAEQRLHSYGWVDRARGIVHVPLEVAIEQYLQEAK